MLKTNSDPITLISNHTLPVLLEKNEGVSQKDMIIADNPNLKEVDILYMEGTAKKIIKAALLQLNRMLSLKDENKIDGFQADYFSKIIFQHCQVLSLDEIGDMFSKIISGHFGTFYGHIDPMLLIDWCRKYVSSRSKIIIDEPELYRKFRDREWEEQDKNKIR